MTDATNTNPAAATEVKLTAREKLVEKYNKLALKASDIAVEITAVVNAIKEIDALNSITEGTEVVFITGKGDDVTETIGSVIGVKEDADGSKVYKVQYGSGFDADIAVVKSNRIKLSVPAADASPEAHGYPE